ncbi:TRAP transporter small permease [Salipiger sp. PrR007]|uniref:TRAP transporter small permease n=1 Tax=Salipiger sp. PrR007 TaxID=2706884 RepID=UPI0013BD0AAF|nr:TRAP transporter small permease [Salipiger sp. PrR007]NDW33416.1 TRAP transporter small permease [Salipiger sp. PrR007]
MRILNAISRLLDGVVWFIYAASSLAMASLVALAAWQVWGRYVMNNSPTWTEQVTMMLLLYITLPLAAVGIRQHFHLAVEILPNALHRNALRWQQRFVLVVLGIYGGFMMVYGFDLVERTARQMVPLLGISRKYSYLPLVISGALTLIFVAELLVRSFVTEREPEPAAQPQITL